MSHDKGETLSAEEAERAAFVAAVERGRADIAAGRFVTLEEMEAELERIERG